MQWINIKDKKPELWSQHGSEYGSGYLLVYTNLGEVMISQLWSDDTWEDLVEGENVLYWANFDYPETMVIKFNGGAGAILCSGCNAIIYEGSSIPKEFETAFKNGEKFHPQYCKKCQKQN